MTGGGHRAIAAPDHHAHGVVDLGAQKGVTQFDQHGAVLRVARLGLVQHDPGDGALVEGFVRDVLVCVRHEGTIRYCEQARNCPKSANFGQFASARRKELERQDNGRGRPWCTVHMGQTDPRATRHLTLARLATQLTHRLVHLPSAPCPVLQPAISMSSGPMAAALYTARPHRRSARHLMTAAASHRARRACAAAAGNSAPVRPRSPRPRTPCAGRNSGSAPRQHGAQHRVPHPPAQP